jgi:hypothetical protein
MRKKIAYAVFTLTDSGLEYMVKGNFGEHKDLAEKWKRDHIYDYPNGLFVKEVKY